MEKASLFIVGANALLCLLGVERDSVQWGLL